MKDPVNNKNNRRVGVIARILFGERRRKQHTNKLSQAKHKTYKVVCG